MKSNLVIDGIVILVIAVILEIARGFVSGIIDLALLIAVIILVIVGIIRLIEGLIAKPRRRAPRTIHHVHHYEKPASRKK